MAHQKRKLLNLEEAADFVGITPRQLHRAAKAGRVAYLKPGGHTGRLMFTPEDLQAFIDSVRVEAQ
ncbi:MAG TPA: helix-turn-helix domain-containing protein [Streptosporangiaceae bacterium]|nr:helix-turn-helix domain-containing protein [Streptosporangiaceae bacterium]